MPKKKKPVTKKLTKGQQDALARHKKHHTAAHMTDMRKRMRNGASFTAAHKAAMRTVGR